LLSPAGIDTGTPGNILQSSASNDKKLLWVIVVVLLPLLGLILWYFLGPRGGKA